MKTYEITLRVTLRELGAGEAELDAESAREVLVGEVTDAGARKFADGLCNAAVHDAFPGWVTGESCEVVSCRPVKG